MSLASTGQSTPLDHSGFRLLSYARSLTETGSDVSHLEKQEVRYSRCYGQDNLLWVHDIGEQEPSTQGLSVDPCDLLVLAGTDHPPAVVLEDLQHPDSSLLVNLPLPKQTYGADLARPPLI